MTSKTIRNIYEACISILPHHIAQKYLITSVVTIPTKVHLRILAKHEIRFDKIGLSLPWCLSAK
jgi:hypothetical protein